jgi:hypothetical protein
MKYLALLALCVMPLTKLHAQAQTGVSQEEMKELGELMKLDPPGFCAAVPLIIKVDLAVVSAQRTFFDGQSLSEKMGYESGYNTMETKLRKCAHDAPMDNDAGSFQQDMMGLTLVQGMHVDLLQSSLINAISAIDKINQIAVEPPTVVVNTPPPQVIVETPPAPQLTKAQRIALALQGVGSSLQQWAIYQNQLNLARVQRQIHCTTTRRGSNIISTDCY